MYLSATKRKTTNELVTRVDLHNTHDHKSDMRWDAAGRDRGQQMLSTKNMAQEEGEGRAMVWLHRCCAGATGPRAGRHKERLRRTVCRLGGGDTSAEPRPYLASRQALTAGARAGRRPGGFNMDAWTLATLTASNSRGGISERWCQVYIFIYFSYM